MARHTTMHACIVRCRGPARADRIGTVRTAERVTFLMQLFYSPPLLFDSLIKVTRYVVSLSPRRSFRPLFFDVYEPAISMLGRETNGLVSGGSGWRARCASFWLLFGRAYADLPIAKDYGVRVLNKSQVYDNLR